MMASIYDDYVLMTLEPPFTPERNLDQSDH